MPSRSPTTHLKSLLGLSYDTVLKILCLLVTSVERLCSKIVYKIFSSHNHGKSQDRVRDREINGANS